MTPNRIQLGEVFGIQISTGSVESSESNENQEDIRSIDEH